MNGRTYYQLRAFISNRDGLFYDGRVEMSDSLINYLVSKINTLSSILRLSTGEQLQVLNQISTSQLVRKSDLFTFYLQNNLMEIPANDLSGLSSLADQAWRQFYTRMNFETKKNKNYLKN